MDSSALWLAYEDILTHYVAAVPDQQLINAAEQSLSSDLASQPTLPMLTAPLALAPAPTGDSNSDWASFAQAYDAMVQKLPDWADQSRPDHAALSAMVASLGDSRSTFLTPQNVQDTQSSAFVGIGVLITPAHDGGGPLIAEVFDQSPASTAGLQRGDRIVQVNGQSVAGQSASQVGTLIRGPAGQTVTLTIQRFGRNGTATAQVVRAAVQPDPMVFGMASGAPIAYLRLRSFSTAAGQDGVDAVQYGLAHGARGWVIDLRGNSGGSLAALSQIAASFLSDQGVVLGYQIGRDQTQTAITADGTNLVDQQPIVILVDGGTAADAEIFASAFRDLGIARLVGTPTEGNVSVTQVYPLADGSAIQLMQGQFVTRSGNQIDGVGVQPDETVATTDQDIMQDGDPPLDAAISDVKSQLSQSHS